MKTEIIDDKDGVILQFDMETGLAMGLKLSDEQAQEFIDIIQNKLNARIQ